jgi:hypothetical protein
MAASDTLHFNDDFPWSPLSATASIFPAQLAPARDDVGTAILVELGTLRPFGLGPDAEVDEPEGCA